MKKENNFPNSGTNDTEYNIPDIDIIDLDLEPSPSSEESVHSEASKDAESGDNDMDFVDPAPKRKLPKFINIHVIFVLVVIAIVVFILFRLSNWGVHVDLDEIFKDGPGTYEDTLDTMLPLMDENYSIITFEEPATIVAFGNAPFADDRDSEDNLANIIADETGATVYNCSIEGSYLAAQNGYFDEDIAPMDIFGFYWLASLAVDAPIDPYFEAAKKELMLENSYPEEADEVIETIKTLDFNTVDVVVIMYDATDYLQGHGMYNDLDSTDIQQFTGNLEAGIMLMQDIYPHIRFIVMSPTYAYAVDEDGNYVSSDQYTYGEQDVLSTYVIKQCGSCNSLGVSFVDHLYGTITEDNAKEYLVDNLHLNVKGRELVAERFAYFLNYYNKK